MTVFEWMRDNCTLDQMCRLRAILVKNESVWSNDEKSVIKEIVENLSSLVNQKIVSVGDVWDKVYPKDILIAVNWVFSNKFYNEVREMPPEPPQNYYYDHYQNLKNEVEQFLGRNDRVISVRLVESRPCYDTKWEVKMLLDGEVFIKQIVRRDTETHFALAKTLMSVNSIDEIMALDEHDSIYYD